MSPLVSISSFGRNCTLVAVREISRLNDARILEAFLARGHRPGRGCHAELFVGAARDLGLVLLDVSIDLHWSACRRYLRGPTLGDFCRLHRTGVHLVRVRGHALVVRDGVVIDPNVGRPGLARRVISAWLCTNPAAVPVGTRLRVRYHQRVAHLGDLVRWLRATDPDDHTIERVVAQTGVTRRLIRRWLRRGIVTLEA